ncbi:MAG TPA: chemotaxis protein CheA [Terriglobales bacterium]|nr:chemotaxis protein CheA [Terriglobales bacterium]
MSFFSEEQGSELKEIFFESARELLQALNEEGLQLEHDPGNPEIIRSVRRTVHTLKGDSAACGYREISELAHELEDVLTPELAKSKNGSMAELVLSAADIFDAMLKAYRNNAPPPSGDALRAYIRLMTQPVVTQHTAPPTEAKASASGLLANFEWTEYERMVIANACNQGKKILLVAVGIDENCPMRAAALQLVRNVLEEAGQILAIRPEQADTPAVNVIEAALVTEFDHDWIVRKCQIPAVVSDIMVRPYQLPQAPPPPPPPVAAPEPTSVAPPEPKPLEDDALDLTPNPTVAAPTPTEPPEPKESGPSASAWAHVGISAEGLVPESKPIAHEPQAAASAAPGAAAENTLRVDAGRIDTVLNLVGELIIGKSMLHQTVGEFDHQFPKDPLRAKFADAMAFQARVLSDLQKSVMKIRMVPVEQLFRRFPRLVRDVAKARNRDVVLEVFGEDTDLDKSILDVLAEPLTHLIRNAVDHGIESPAERVSKGKPSQGKLQLKAYHQGNQVVIEVSDDGRGIDRNKVVAKAIDCKIINHDEAMRLTEGEALNLIFHPGLSTAESVTAISGRGVGMDVVKTVLERLKGTVQIETKIGEGTRFFLKVPLTLAIIQALLFRVVDKLYAVPLGSVVEITRAYENEFHKVDNREVFKLRDKVLTLVRLGKLTRSKKTSGSKKVFIIVISMGDHRFGLVVDKLVGEEELVIKALDDQLVATDLVSGASILGDGTVVLILNISAVVQKLGKARPESAPVNQRGATA